MAVADSMTHTVARDSSVYYGTGYWNDLPLVAAYMESRAAGRPNVRWYEHLLEATGRRGFRKGLFLNCGNGWVERDLLASGVVSDAVGIDISEQLLDGAREAAAEAGLSARYYAVDINTADFPEDGYDLVVNYAAGHHIAYLDRVLRKISTILPADGVFASFDYIGPHRNQYPYDQWQAAVALNEELPEKFRASLAYPHLPSMLLADPTEGIHSELILETTKRYFRLEEFNPIGGGLAYLLLTFNPQVHGSTGDEQQAVVQRILDEDARWTAEHGPMFAFFWGRPNPDVLTDSASLNRWAREENERESAAAKAGGQYYPLTVLQSLTQETETLQQSAAALSRTIAELREKASTEGGDTPAYRNLREALIGTLHTRAPAAESALRQARQRLSQLRRQ
jgi:SAM-dependent methyltransferase